MGIRSLIVLASVILLSTIGGCKKDPTKVQPETRGKRGENCLARNDCESGLACLNGTCAKNEFGLEVAANQCVRIECDIDEDCCGDRPTSAPAKCRGRDSICSMPTLPGCVATTCVDDTTCGGGASCLGTCVGTGQVAGTTCTVASDCPKVTNTCVMGTGLTYGYCSLTNTYCTSTILCTTPTATCSSKTCRCQNPDYQPTNTICTDPDCEDICLLRCEDNLCLQDKSCKVDTDCASVGLRICDDGRCVECTTNKDCDEKNDETCDSGQCHKPCKQNEECPLFNECVKGDCVYVGCQSDRECILASARGTQSNTGGTSGLGALASISGSDDPRLYKCLPADDGTKLNVCKIPCENDGSCGQFQACDNGYCKFVGCEEDEECRAYLGIANQMTSDAKPYVATARCEPPKTTK